MSTETEIKIPVVDLAPLRHCLEKRGARRIHGPLRERNALFDTDDGQLRTAGRALRVRTLGSRHLLTLKGPVTYLGAVKTRDELEVEFADRRIVEEILRHLGYSVVVEYEKDREEWHLDPTIINLDHTPMGNFVEIEGPPDSLSPAAVAMGLDPGAAVRDSYLGLWATYRRRHPSLRLPSNMVFVE
jgi:adenylate cyclase class 2